MSRKTKKIILCGTGIKCISHVTVETKAAVKKADLVLYLVNEPIIEQWIQKQAKEATSLSDLYFSHSKRKESYTAIKNKILSTLEKYGFVCVVIYGHPTVFASPGLDAILEAKSLGVNCKIYPGISAEDCLFSDLMIDPGSRGCYSVEATELLVCEKKFDTSSYLIIWQAGMIANIGMPSGSINLQALELLQSYLLKYYGPSHEVVLYEASLYPKIEPKIVRFKLKELVAQDLSTISTLVFCPCSKNNINQKTLSDLNLV